MKAKIMKVQWGTVRRDWQQNLGVVCTMEKSTFARAESQIKFIHQRYSALVTLCKHVAQSFLMRMQLRADVPVINKYYSQHR